MDDRKNSVLDIDTDADEVSKFADSYASFTRVINALQRKYIELEEDFSSQNKELASANNRLVELAEKNLTATEFLNGILSSTSAGVIAVDKEGIVTHFNEAASRILNISLKKAYNSHYDSFIPAGTPENANALSSLKKNKTVDSIERRLEMADGTTRSVSVSTAILRNNDGKALGAVEVFQDLTHIKKMEQELARLNTLAMLGEMAATVAHEVRNPLAGIAGFAALLQKDIEKTDPRYRLVENIIRGVDTLNETVTTLLNYSRSEELNKTNIDLDKFITSIISQFKNECTDLVAKTGITYNPMSKHHNKSVNISVDPVLFRQVLFNLFANAINSFKGNGKLIISSKIIAREDIKKYLADRVLFGSDETVLEISVTDNGPGIPEENIEKIFTPFFTTRSNGNGLGLAVAWKILKAHGGDIVAENNMERGATFRMFIPIKLDAIYMER
ncbi:MAG: ATP-binding protein [bacterium]